MRLRLVSNSWPERVSGKIALGSRYSEVSNASTVIVSEVETSVGDRSGNPRRFSTPLE